MKNRKIYAAFLAVMVMAGVSCKKEYLSTGPIITEPVTYAAKIQPIWNKTCLTSSCHGTGGIPPILESAVSYNNLVSGNYIDSLNKVASTVPLYQYITGSNGMTPMPSGGLPSSEAGLVKAWIEDGSKNN